MKEIWKKIKGFEDIYEISNKGRIRSLDRIIIKKNGSVFYKKGKILSNRNKNGDYLRVVLRSNIHKKYRSISLHRLVVEHFIGYIPEKHHVHHKDQNKQNNNIENLEIISTKEHYKICKIESPQIVSGMKRYNQIVKPNPILQFDKEMNFISEYPNSKEAERKTGVCSRNILQVANKDEFKPGHIRKQAGGYKWIFKKDYINKISKKEVQQKLSFAS